MEKAKLLRSIADEIRLRILNLLMSAKTPLCVCELVDALKLPQYLVSRHLMILKNAGLVKAEKQGTWAYHFVDLSRKEHQVIFTFLKAFLRERIFDEDRREIEKRLLLREDGKCVVGFVSDQELDKIYELKNTF